MVICSCDTNLIFTLSLGEIILVKGVSLCSPCESIVSVAATTGITLFRRVTPSHAFLFLTEEIKMTKITKLGGWDVYRKNIRLVRKHFKISQEELAEKIGCTRSSYQHNEAEGFCTILPLIIDFWYNNYGITPNDLLLEPLTKEKIVEIEQRVKRNNSYKRVVVKVKRVR